MLLCNFLCLIFHTNCKNYAVPTIGTIRNFPFDYSYFLSDALYFQSFSYFLGVAISADFTATAATAATAAIIYQKYQWNTQKKSFSLWDQGLYHHWCLTTVIVEEDQINAPVSSPLAFIQLTNNRQRSSVALKHQK